MGKTIYITESQFKSLVEKKKNDIITYKAICEEIDAKKSLLKEGMDLNEDIVKTIKGYLRAGALTVSILAALLGAQKVDSNQLHQAGVPKEMVQQAQQKVQQTQQKTVTPIAPVQQTQGLQ